LGDEPAGFGGAFGCENGFTATILGLVLCPWPQCSIGEKHEVAMERTKSVFASRRFEVLGPDSPARLGFNFSYDFRDGDSVLIPRRTRVSPKVAYGLKVDAADRGKFLKRKFDNRSDLTRVQAGNDCGNEDHTNAVSGAVLDG
jgi:hypothetical protein